MRNLNQKAVQANKSFERHAVFERNQKPAQQIRWRNEGEKGIRLDHGNGVDSKQKLMFLVGILHHCHERVCQDCDQNGDNKEMADEEKQRQQHLSQDVCVDPDVPRRRSETHEQLEQGICCIAWSQLVIISIVILQDIVDTLTSFLKAKVKATKKPEQLMTIRTKIATRSIAIIRKAIKSWEK
jgi:hypothetical protein